MAQLVQQSILIPEVRGTTPAIGKILLNIYLLTCLLSTALNGRKLKKEAGNGPLFLKKTIEVNLKIVQIYQLLQMPARYCVNKIIKASFVAPPTHAKAIKNLAKKGLFNSDGSRCCCFDDRSEGTKPLTRYKQCDQ